MDNHDNTKEHVRGRYCVRGRNMCDVWMEQSADGFNFTKIIKPDDENKDNDKTAKPKQVH